MTMRMCVARLHIKGENMKQRLAALTLVLGLAACGGGGGSGSSTMAVTPIGPATPTPVTPTITVQRTLVQQALSSTQQGSSIATFGSPGSTTLSVARRAMSGERFAKATTTTACTNSTTTSITQGNDPNVLTLVANGYYDSVCTKIQIALILTITATSSSSATAVGNVTNYSLAGAVTQYDKLALALAGVGTMTQTVSVRDDVAANQTATPPINLGIGCSVAKTADTCSLAAALHLTTLNVDQAAAATVSGAVSVLASGLTSVAINGTGTASSGALNSTNIAAVGAYQWNTTGGTLVDTATIAGTLQYTSLGSVAGGSLGLTDSVDNAAASATYSSASGLLTGTVNAISPAQQIATFSVNAQGSGTVTYSNGTTAAITNWLIQG